MKYKKLKHVPNNFRRSKPLTLEERLIELPSVPFDSLSPVFYNSGIINSR